MRQVFSEDVRNVALRNNGVKSFTEYKLKQGEYKVLLPQEWIVKEERDNIDEKELEVEFNSDKIEGNITILNSLYSKDDIESIISKEWKNKRCYGYKSEGVLWNVIDYEVKEDSKTFTNKCYFREYSEGKVILIRFKYNSNKFKPSMEVVFEEIVNNFR